MPRRLRLLPAGFAVHVVQRGLNRAACFHRDSDYLCYLQLLTEHARTFACAVHAYALMTNHVHLLLTPDDDGAVSLLMKNLGRRYTQYMNGTRGRSGTLWEGRFESSVIADDAYLLACHRYIELNPVRAGLVADPCEYEWSSHRSNAGFDLSALTKRHPVYVDLASHDAACAAAYRGLFARDLRSETVDEIRTAVERGLPLGRRECRARFAAASRIETVECNKRRLQN